MSGVTIEARDLRKAWPGKGPAGESVAVDDIAFTAPAGKFTVLLGPSGCGKSTTLRLIAGLESATAGTILIDGRDVTQRPPNDRQIAMVFQSYALFPHLDVAENILFGLKVRRVPAAERLDRLERTAALLGLDALLDRRPSQLSGGQQQRVALGRAIIAEKPICLMDEPLSNLDAKLRHEMRVELRALQRKLGITMVYVTHDQAEAMSMADKIVVLNKGRIEQDAAPADIYDAPATAFTARFIGTPPMNLIEVARTAEGWRVPGAPTIVLPADAAGDRTRLLLGIRPEDLALVESGGLPVTVETVEYLGADNMVECRLGEARLIARLPRHVSVKAADPIRLGWPEDAIHLFDTASGARLPPPAAAQEPGAMTARAAP
jgi:sn-glycerol 3-phosphate transport system ATP-binding protein